MVRVNDRWEVPWHEGMTVGDVLAACNFTHHYVAVSINGKLVPPVPHASGGPARHAAQPVADGDQIQVIHIIGGG
jgi:thiamine biosynthesis protein ThiS